MIIKRLWRQILDVSVRIKIMGIALGMLMMLSLGVIWHVRTVFRTTLYRELGARGVSLAQDIANRCADYVLTNDRFELYRIAQQMVRQYDDVRYVLMLDRQGKVLAHTFGDRFPMDLIGVNYVEQGATSHRVALDTEEGGIWDIAVPILNGLAGTVRIGLTEARVQGQLRATTRYLLAVTSGIAVLGTIAAYVLIAVMTRPIQELEAVARQVGDQNFSSRARIHFHDEVGRLAMAFNEMIDKLRESHAAIETYTRELVRRDQMRRELLHQVMVAQEQERYRIARELHDEMTQSLAALSIQLGQIERDALRQNKIDISRLQMAQQMAKGLVQEVRRIIHNLRPARLDDFGLVPAIRWWIQQLSGDQQIEFQLDFPNTALELPASHQGLEPAEVQVHLFRIVQEGITNILRHAHAKHVRLALMADAERLTLTIVDDGIGFDYQSVLNAQDGKPHFGLRGIAERVELLGGTFEIISEIGKGTKLHIEIPLEGEGEHHEEDPHSHSRRS